MRRSRTLRVCATLVIVLSAALVIFSPQSSPLPTPSPLPPPLCLSRTAVISKIQLLERHLAARRADGTCSGPHDGLVCDATRFWSANVPEPAHVSSALANAHAFAADDAAATRATPWLTIGALKFTANDYVDWREYAPARASRS